MSFNDTWSDWWRRFLNVAFDESTNTLDILRMRYIDEMQRVERFKQYAKRMHYPQYREKLLQMAKEKGEHAERIGKKIVSLGGRLPDLQERRATDDNSWLSLAMALDEENRAADRLPQQLRGIESAHPDIAGFLQQISREQENHRGDIRDMMMRSDPFAHSLA